MERVILHADMNAFYASVECLHRPELRDKPVAVAGDAEARHGIILTRNQIAKRFGVKTGEAIWQAREKCPELVTVPPNFPLYLRFSEMARNIYRDYSDRIEPFGIDEAWIDVTGCTHLYGSGEAIANEISRRIKEELGLTVSIGVSWNKIFAKLGSDYKKPDAITVFSRENYKELIWPLPVGDLLYVGPATRRKLRSMCVHTIGELAQIEPQMLRARLGKMGDILWGFANGLDQTPVAMDGDAPAVKSIGNGCTAPRDLVCDEDAKLLLCALTESVAMRLREQGLCARTVVVGIRDNGLYSYERQAKLQNATDLTEDILTAALAILRADYRWHRPIRSLTVRVTDLCAGSQPIQLDLYTDAERREKQEQLDRTLDWLRSRFGNRCIQRAVLLTDKKFAAIDAKSDHIIHPVGFF
ncbi:DNA polymerase IV [Agathobaculum sp.]|uniref:DNA polymerase IV n=1 Tax=Agathobaculum sp. TaxID=2048138 RepID=UPI002A7FFE45|nr:DNA polymerase IV [Agathobaculum sp.]MDY3617645.1 DNA polymerase IV [Agathobaculum sp.]